MRDSTARRTVTASDRNRRRPPAPQPRPDDQRGRQRARDGRRRARRRRRRVSMPPAGERPQPLAQREPSRAGAPCVEPPVAEPANHSTSPTGSSTRRRPAATTSPPTPATPIAATAAASSAKPTKPVRIGPGSGSPHSAVQHGEHERREQDRHRGQPRRQPLADRRGAAPAPARRAAGRGSPVRSSSANARIVSTGTVTTTAGPAIGNSGWTTAWRADLQLVDDEQRRARPGTRRRRPRAAATSTASPGPCGTDRSALMCRARPPDEAEEARLEVGGVAGPLLGDDRDRRASTTTRSHIAAASASRWVDTSTAAPRRPRRRTSRRASTTCAGSSDAVGSSSTSDGGVPSTAWASPTRWRWPLLSRPIGRRARSATPASFMARRSPTGRGAVCGTRTAGSRATDSASYGGELLGQVADRPRRPRRVPAVGPQQTEQHPHRRRLAGAVRSEQPDDLAGRRP